MTRFVSSMEARARLRVHSGTFARLVAAGAYRRDAFGLFDVETLAENHGRALEIEKRAEAQIALIRRVAARRIASLGAPPQVERKLP